MNDSGSSGQFATVRQQEVVQEIGRHIVSSAPDGWNTLIYETFGVVGLQEATLQVAVGGGQTQWLRPPPAAASLAHELRQMMYQQGAGTWFSARFTVVHPKSLDATFNYDDEPHWDAPIDPAHYTREMKKFPRDALATPEWLRQRTLGVDVA